MVNDYLVSEKIFDIKDTDSLFYLLQNSSMSGKVIIETLELADSIIPDGTPVFFHKKKYKVKGEVWVVHMSDADPFPSSPHAHNYDQNLVLHLGNGSLYRDREFVSKLKKKEFIKLRSLVNNVTLPPLEA